MTLTFNPLRAMVMTYSQAKVQGQRSVGSEDRVETNGRTDRRTDGGDCITSHADAVGKYSAVSTVVIQTELKTGSSSISHSHVHVSV